jgi:cytohesin
MAAAMDCEVDELRRLAPLQKDVKGPAGHTALHWALMRRCREGAMVLLDAGSDAGLGSSWPLLSAALGDLKLADALIAHGAPVNIADRSDMSPLHAAAGSQEVPAIEYLLARGAKVGTLDRFGATPLHYGARHGGVVKTLIAAGADPNARDDGGRTPVMAAHSYPHIRELTGAGGLRALLEAGADVHAVNKDGETALMHAARAFDPQTVEELLRAGSNVHARSKAGQTALGIVRSTNANTGISFFSWWVILPFLDREPETKPKVEALLLAAGATE